MTTFLIVAYVAAVTLLLTASLSTNVRLVRQRDAAEVRNVRLAMRNTVLMEQLDKQIEETDYQRGKANEFRSIAWDHEARVAQLEAEALPKAPNWGAAPAEWREQNATPSIFMLHAIENGVVA